MRASNRFSRSGIEPEKIRRIIDRFAENGGNALSFTGGEPFLFFDDLAGHIEYACKKGITHIRTGTNGFFMKNHEAPDFRDRIGRMAEKLARAGLRNLWISIDSSDAETHEKMRGLEGVIKGMEKALPVFHSSGIYPSANLGINRNMAGFDRKLACPDRDQFFEKALEAFRKFYGFVTDTGFTIANCCYPMSIGSENKNLDPVYAATSDDVTSFETWEKILIYRALFDVIPEFRKKIRIFSPRSSLFTLIKQHEGHAEKSAPCRGGIDFFFVSAADGLVYPCGYRGRECLGDYADMDKSSAGAVPFCRECDWECFRDPSELFSPFAGLVENPAGFAKKILGDDKFMKIWKEDIRYFIGCGFFDGRKPFYARKIASS